jgi:ABC-type sugar transport system substrate-binding protein
MNPFVTPRARRPRAVAATSSALLCALAMTLAACGSDDDPSDGSSSGASGAGSTASAASSKLDVVMQPVDGYTLPTDPVDASSLSGKTVYYIPITQQTPAFKVTSDAMTEALDAVGMKLQICDGAANPSSTSACVAQAVGAGAAGIVTDSIPYGFAANALSDAQAQGVPVLITDQLEDPDHPAGDDLAYLPGPGIAMLEAIARWVIEDSGGKAVVVANEVTDNPSAIAYMEAAVKVFEDECPDCTVEVNKISAANFPQVAPATSAAIAKTPGTNYVLSEFDAFLQPTFGGIQATGQGASIKLVSTAATLSSFQAMAKGQPPVADVGQSLPFQGWSDADAILRLILKQPVPEYDIPIRLFSADNVGDIDLTEDASASGEWFGPTDFTDQYKSLWGVS